MVVLNNQKVFIIYHLQCRFNANGHKTSETCWWRRLWSRGYPPQAAHWWGRRLWSRRCASKKTGTDKNTMMYFLLATLYLLLSKASTWNQAAKETTPMWYCTNQKLGSCRLPATIFLMRWECIYLFFLSRPYVHKTQSAFIRGSSKESTHDEDKSQHFLSSRISHWIIAMHPLICVCCASLMCFWTCVKNHQKIANNICFLRSFAYYVRANKLQQCMPKNLRIEPLGFTCLLVILCLHNNFITSPPSADVLVPFYQ